MDFQKIPKSWNLLYLRVLRAQKQWSKFQKFGLSTKNVIETQKCIQAAWPPLVLLIFNLPCQLWGVITFEWFISLCWNFQDNLISYIPFIWKSFIKIWDGSCPALVHLTWNDPLSIHIMQFWIIFDFHFILIWFLNLYHRVLCPTRKLFSK